MDKTRIYASIQNLEEIQAKLEEAATETSVEYLGKVFESDMGYALDGVAMLIQCVKMETISNFKKRLDENPDDENKETLLEYISELEAEPLHWRLEGHSHDAK